MIKPKIMKVSKKGFGYRLYLPSSSPDCADDGGYVWWEPSFAGALKALEAWYKGGINELGKKASWA